MTFWAPQTGCFPFFHHSFECPLCYPMCQVSTHSLKTHYPRKLVTPSWGPQGLCAELESWEIILYEMLYTSVFPSLLQAPRGKDQPSSPFTRETPAASMAPSTLLMLNKFKERRSREEEFHLTLLPWPHGSGAEGGVLVDGVEVGHSLDEGGAGQNSGADLNPSCPAHAQTFFPPPYTSRMSSNISQRSLHTNLSRHSLPTGNH